MVAGPGGGWYAARVLGSLGRNNKNYIFKLSSAPHSQARLSSTQSSSPPAAHTATIMRQRDRWGPEERFNLVNFSGLGESLTRFPLDLITLLVLLWCSVPSPAHTQPSPAQRGERIIGEILTDCLILLLPIAIQPPTLPPINSKLLQLTSI